MCVNVDESWFAEKQTPPPRTLDDLTKPEYKDLFVTPGATTSSPGLAFLLATIAAEGEGWRTYWKTLMANGPKVTSGWTDAYEVDFTAGGGGDRPIVTSYSSSPPFTIPEGGPADHGALLDTCFRQVEYAGVLEGRRRTLRAWRSSSTSCSAGSSRRRCRTTCTSTRSTPVELPGGVGAVRPRLAEAATPSTPTRWPPTGPSGCASGGTSPASDAGFFGPSAGGHAALAAVPLAVLTVFFVYPVLGMVARGFWPDGTFDPGAVLEVLGRPRVHRVLWFTVWSAGGWPPRWPSWAGLPVAFVLHRLRFPGRDLVRALVVVPFVLPTVVVGVAFRQLIAPLRPARRPPP